MPRPNKAMPRPPQPPPVLGCSPCAPAHPFLGAPSFGPGPAPCTGPPAHAASPSHATRLTPPRAVQAPCSPLACPGRWCGGKGGKFTTDGGRRGLNALVRRAAAAAEACATCALARSSREGLWPVAAQQPMGKGRWSRVVRGGGRGVAACGGGVRRRGLGKLSLGGVGLFGARGALGWGEMLPRQRQGKALARPAGADRGGSEKQGRHSGAARAGAVSGHPSYQGRRVVNSWGR
jgi:hypothetical protein